MINLNEDEERIIKYWNERSINEKVKAKNREGKPLYFLDGPPFVTGELHLGQVWTKSVKDLLLRYKRYRGYDVVDRAGYDTQGLPTENRIERKLSLSSKRDIEEKVGVEAFMNECRAYIDYYMGKWKNEYERFGVSLDFSNPYLPHENSYIETEWSLFKRVYENGYLYKGVKSTAYCPNCQCVVSQGTMEVEHSDETDPAIYMTFRVDRLRSKNLKIEADGDIYLLAWTTTPWTMPANVAIAVNPSLMYVLARIHNKDMVIAKDRLASVSAALGESAIVLREFYGSELEGLYYTSPLEQRIPKQKELRRYHRVIAAPMLVSSEEGTGLVHIAPGHGLDDYNLGIEKRLPIFCPVGPDALYTEDAGPYKGLSVPEEANTRLMADLREMGMLEQFGSIVHSYPHCWRCHSKVIFIATPQWFLNVQKVKKKLLKVSEKITWQPPEARSWERDLITNSPDWCISRQRYWAAPMPIWECGNCGAYEVMGSRRELEERATDPDYVRSMKDLHRPYIDGVKLKCGKCGSEMPRVKDVIDVWFDSSTAFRSSLTEEQFSRLFPVEFVVEYSEQIRAWFQYMIKSSMFIYGKSPIKNIVVHGILKGTDGRAMHKSLGNFTPVAEMVKTVSADATRFWLLDHTQIENRNLNEREIKETERIVLMLHNISNLLKEYSEAVNYRPALKSMRKVRSMEDRWIISRCMSTLQEVMKSFDSYEPSGAAEAVKCFIIDDFSRFYLKLAKKRILYRDRREARAAIDTINSVLFSTLITVGPMMPLVAESVYLDRYNAKESVFLEEWPKLKKGLVDTALETEFTVAQEAITAVLNSREKAGIPLRWPVASATIEVTDDSAYSAIEKMAQIIEDSVNAKHLELKKVSGVMREIRPLFAKIGPDFKGKAQAVSDALRKTDADALLSSIARDGRYLLDTEKGPVEVTQDHFSTVEKVDEKDAALFRYGKAYVDANITRELKDEALVREFEHEVQGMRKELGLRKTDRIELGYVAVGSISETIKANSKKIAKDVNSARLTNRLEEGAVVKDLSMEGETVKVSVRQVPGKA